jgi:hypothetical protein
MDSRNCEFLAFCNRQYLYVFEINEMGFSECRDMKQLEDPQASSSISYFP